MTRPETSLRDLTGEQFGPYKIIRRLGIGGMAETFEAIRSGPSGFEQRVCLKLVLPFFQQDEGFIELFHREAKLAATLRHSNIVGVIDFDEVDGKSYMALELVDGCDLRRLLEAQDRSRLSPELVALIGLDIAAALEHAHNPDERRSPDESGSVRQGIVHRDISPGNVLISRLGEVMLTDFGIAKAITGTARKQSSVKGKIPYMSPQQLKGDVIDGRSDLFALGVVMFEALSGRRPYEGPNDPATILLTLNGEHPSLRTLAPNAPLKLREIIESLLEPDAQRRPQTAAELIELLEEFTPSHRAHRKLGDMVAQTPKVASLAQHVPSAGGESLSPKPPRSIVGLRPTRAALEATSVESQAAADEFLPVRTLDVVPHNLPIELTSFVGREAEVAEVAELLNDARLLTLTGVGGVGKSRVALRVAAGAIDQLRDGVWLVELAALSDPELIPKQVAVAMGVQEQANRPIAATLLEVTSSKEVLLVLDNCEHLIEGVATLAEELLRSCPGVRLLTTSREPLGVSGETAWTLAPMSVPAVDIGPDPDRLGAIESMSLFIDRARLADREFSLSADNAAACAEICRRLDGVPLAIELAAARASALSPHQIAERLEDRFALLVKGTRTALPRQQTLRATIDWSYELLTPDEQRLFRCLSVFRGGFTLEAVQALWSDGDKSDQDALELLTHLVDKSLVVISSRAEARRFGLLETIRQYAWERLESAGETDVTLAQHRQWFTSWAAKQQRLLSTPDQLGALEALEADYDNLRAILERSMASGDVEPALRIGADISYFWWLHSHFGEAGAWFQRLLAVGERASPYVRSKLLLGAGHFSCSMSEHELAEERFTEARRIAQEINAPRLEGWALAHLTFNEFYRLDLDAARVYGEQSLRIFQNAGDLLGIGWVTCVQIWVDYSELWRKNEITPEVAEDLMSKLQPVLAEAQQLGDRNFLGHVLDALGLFALEAGRIDEAGAHFSEAVTAHDTVANKSALAHALDRVALLATRANQPAAAIRLLGATTSLKQHLGVSARLAEQIIVVDEALDTARKNLTPDRFKDAWAEGTRMTRDQAIQHARTIIHATVG